MKPNGFVAEATPPAPFCFRHLYLYPIHTPTGNFEVSKIFWGGEQEVSINIFLRRRNMSNSNTATANPWLDQDQVEALTGFKRPSKQIEALNQMMIPCKVRPDGSVVVFEADLTTDKPKTVEFKINA